MLCNGGEEILKPKNHKKRQKLLCHSCKHFHTISPTNTLFIHNSIQHQASFQVFVFILIIDLCISFPMAQNSSRKALHILAPFCLLLLIHNATGYEFKVGGGGDWTVPSDPNAKSYSQWAERSRFQIGDTVGEFSPLYYYSLVNKMANKWIKIWI